jgi:hypothetical protein
MRIAAIKPAKAVAGKACDQSILVPGGEIGYWYDGEDGSSADLP